MAFSLEAIDNNILKELIDKFIAMTRKPAPTLPPLYTTIEGLSRPGMSEETLTTNVVKRLGEGRMSCEKLPDGTEPWIGGFIRLMVEETIKEIQLNQKGMVEIPPGTLLGNAGAVPVVTTVPVQGYSVVL